MLCTGAGFTHLPNRRTLCNISSFIMPRGEDDDMGTLVNTRKEGRLSFCSVKPARGHKCSCAAGHHLPNLGTSKDASWQNTARVSRTASELPESLCGSQGVSQTIEIPLTSPVSQAEHPFWPSALVSSHHWSFDGLSGDIRPGEAWFCH